MKITTIIFMMILVSLQVYGITAGTTTKVLDLPQCTNLIVDVVGVLQIDEGEYWFSNCNNLGNNRWNCVCHDGYELYITTNLTTINNYTITATYDYEENVANVRRSSSGYRRITVVEDDKDNITIIVPKPKSEIESEDKINVTEDIIFISIVEDNITREVNVTVVDEKEKPYWWWWIIGIIIIFLIGIGCVIYFIFKD